MKRPGDLPRGGLFGVCKAHEAVSGRIGRSLHVGFGCFLLQALRQISATATMRFMAEDSKSQQIAIAQALHLLHTFRGADLTQTIYQIEKSVKGVPAEKYAAVLQRAGRKLRFLVQQV